MRFFDPSNVFIEHDCVKAHKKELAAMGKKAFIITGRHSAKTNGSQDDVTDVLTEAGIPYIIFDEVEENPSVETVAKASAIGKEAGVDFVIGIGGGSPLDAGKAIALLVANPQETEECLYTRKNLKALPYAAVPTTCGTGAEVTPNAVLTRHALKTKGSISYQIFPDLALVDGKYIASISRKLLVNTAVDALAHLVESRLHSKGNILNYMFSEYGLKLWAGLIPYLKGEKETDSEARQFFMLTSTVAGLAIAQTGTSLPHAMSYFITYRYQVPHGHACGIFLAAYMKEYAKNRPADVETVLSLLGFESADSFSVFLKDLLEPVSISSENLVLFTDDLMKNAGKLATYPFAISKEAVSEILTSSLLIE